ncbi:hypothetical protein Hanom_Chr00s000001g01593141 [Helianthus anomalus]
MHFVRNDHFDSNEHFASNGDFVSNRHFISNGHFVSTHHFASKHHFACNIIPLEKAISFEVSLCLKPFRLNDVLVSNVQFDPLHNICCVYDEKLPKMAAFKEILEFMKRLPIQKTLTDQHLVFRSHVERF